MNSRPSSRARRTTRQRWKLAAATALLAAAGSGHAAASWSSFGTYVNAGGLKQGGEYQSAASASYAPDANKSASAYGDSAGFNLHAYAWTSENPRLPAYCTVYTCTWQTFADVMVWDTITLTPPANSAGDTIKFDFTIDGTKHRGKWAYGDGAYASASYYFGTDPGGWNRATTYALGNGVTEVRGEITAQPGQSFNVYLMGSLSVSARSGSIADYSHTMLFNLDLPTGWTYTSASGHFSPANTPLPAPVPEPASLGLMLAGLGCIVALQRRRTACRR